MKDFFDLWTLATQFEFAGETLAEAIKATFERRETELPSVAPLALTAEFAEDDGKTKQWSAFLLRGKLQPKNVSLVEVAELLNSFLVPLSSAICQDKEFKMSWKPTGPWSPV
jgi:hypothetical protein